jgi:pseudaminic acid biosynthesis-associated methylase
MNSDQLKFWKGSFGDEYTDRNNSSHKNIASRLFLWSQIFSKIDHLNVSSVLEIGANVGNNLRALKQLVGSNLFAVEPNEKAHQKMIDDKVVPAENAFCASAFDLNMLKNDSMDVVFTSGVLIHISPDDLKKVTDEVVRISKKYIICVEYFSDSEVEVQYRGHSSVLFKRDFGSYYLDNYPNLKLVDYGFAWKRVTGLDNLTWFIFEKK